MLVATVIGNVWATRKHDGLRGSKLMVVRPQAFAGEGMPGSLVAVDLIGAGIGETVLVVSGSSARLSAGGDAPVDSVIVAIVDKVDLPGQARAGAPGEAAEQAKGSLI